MKRNPGTRQLKTYKIDETAIGGIIRISLKDNEYIIEFFEYRTKKLVMKGSFTDKDEAQKYLEDGSTPYWAERIINFKDKKD